MADGEVDAIDALLNEVEGSDLKIPFGDLEIGMEYKIRSLTRTSTNMLGNVVPGLMARIVSPDDLRMFTYLPKNYVNIKDELFEKVNSECAAGSFWTVVNYGSVGQGNVGRLHRPNQGLDKELLARMTAMGKRKAENSTILLNMKRPRDGPNGSF